MRALVSVAALFAVAGCGGPSGPCVPNGDGDHPHDKLSAYCLLTNLNGALTPHKSVIPYDLNTPLFSDYALKSRMLFVPTGGSGQYDPDQPFTFPKGTIFIKSFSWPADFRMPDQNVKAVETRLLIKTDTTWVGLPYVWNDAQTEATLVPAGGLPRLSWIDAQGMPVSTTYLIPNESQCRQCHMATGTFGLIGVKARQLNRDYTYTDGSVDNQLVHWTRLGLLSGAPAVADAPKLAEWNNPASGTLDERARAWLEGNCAHCHNEQGLARTTGLFLNASVTAAAQRGLCKTPVAAGPGTGGFQYDIVPGDPDHSILVFRIESTAPGIMMPQIGRSVVHAEGVAMIRDWIKAMSGGCP